MFAALFAALLALLAPAALPVEAPAPAVSHIQPQPPVPGPGSRRGAGTDTRAAVTLPKVGLPSATAGVRTQTVPAGGAAQLPAETDGRQVDCPDGVHVGVMAGGVVTGCP